MQLAHQMADRGCRVRNLDLVLDWLLVEGVFNRGEPNMRSAAEKMSMPYSVAISQRLLMEHCICLSLLPYFLGSTTILA